MKLESNNPGHEVYIDGFPLLGDFIPYNTGVDKDNTINQITGELTSGKSYTKYLNELSENLSFKTVLPDAIAESGYENVLKSVVAKAKETSVKIRFNGTSFMGMVQEFSISFPTESYREYKWVIVESDNFKAVIKKFNTFNYKKAATTTKNTPASSLMATLKMLLDCKPVYNCSKKNVACVKAWQKQLKTDGYYLGYSVDGQFCKYTLKETKRWQAHYKVKVTGKVDKATKMALLTRYVNKSTYNAAYRKTILQAYSNKL